MKSMVSPTDPEWNDLPAGTNAMNLKNQGVDCTSSTNSTISILNATVLKLPFQILKIKITGREQ